jgi:hypothetical protein
VKNTYVTLQLLSLVVVLAGGYTAYLEFSLHTCGSPAGNCSGVTGDVSGRPDGASSAGTGRERTWPGSATPPSALAADIDDANDGYVVDWSWGSAREGGRRGRCFFNLKPTAPNRRLVDRVGARNDVAGETRCEKGGMDRGGPVRA